jgi:zinc and cadmium transporter
VAGASLESFAWIVAGGVLMTAIALVGGLTLVLTQRSFERMIRPLVAFAAGALIGGALFHMLPAAVSERGNQWWVYAWVFAGFGMFFVLEQFMHWHHCNRAETECRKPLTYLILIGDALHNFLGGLAVAGTFLIDIRLGITTWLAAAAHEIPQELGDFGVLVHGGWSKGRALLFNVISASTFLLGGLVSFAASRQLDVTFLVPFAAGNFLYIGASDLVPEVNKHYGLRANLIHAACFAGGAVVLLGIKVALES